MSSDGRRPGTNTRGRGDGRPGSRGTRTTAANGKPGPGRKSAASNDYMKNKSNSATMNEKSLPTDNNRNVAASKAGAVDGRIKVLGQDAEMTESDLWNLNGISSGKTTPLSSRSSTGGSSYRTPTPSKQISLQAVKRKEENTELLETIDWNDFLNPVEEERPVSNVSDSRIPSPPVSESDDSDRDSGLNVMEDRLMLVERRAQEMASALDSHPLNELEENLAKQLERMELEREENERLEKEKEGELISNRERQSNETFRDFDSGNTNHLVKETAIVGASVQPGRSWDPGTAEAQGTSADDIFTVGVGARPKVLTESISKSGSLDKRETVVAAQTNETQSNEKKKKMEASSETKETEESTSDEESEEEEDLIGYKGKAPTQLLMEFLDCMMTEDYTTAEKLCKMILIYEPNNEEALSFYPLIQEKIKQEEEEEEESDSDDDDDEDDDDDDEDDDDDDDDDDDESSSDESEDDREVIPDSGIVSANSDRD